MPQSPPFYAPYICICLHFRFEPPIADRLLYETVRRSDTQGLILCGSFIYSYTTRSLSKFSFKVARMTARIFIFRSFSPSRNWPENRHNYARRTTTSWRFLYLTMYIAILHQIELECVCREIEEMDNCNFWKF